MIISQKNKIPGTHSKKSHRKHTLTAFYFMIPFMSTDNYYWCAK